MDDSEPTGSREIAALTTLRGIAAILVAYFHLRYVYRDVPVMGILLFHSLFGQLSQRGYLWVDLFFLLSGFVLAHRYFTVDDRTLVRGYWPFLRARLARIYPLHFFVLVIFIAVDIFKNGAASVLGAKASLAANFFLFQGWWKTFYPNWNFPSWSISTEWAAYLLFPLNLIWVRKYSARLRVPVGAIVALLGLLAVIASFGKGTLWMSPPYGLLQCLICSLIGICLYPIYLRLRPLPRGAFGPMALSSLACLFAVLLMPGRDFLFVPISALLILSSALAEGFGRRVLAWRPLVWLGEISYSIYMLHLLVGGLMLGLLGAFGKPSLTEATSIAWLLLTLAVLLLVSWATHRYVEMRFQRLLKGPGLSPPPPAEPVPSAPKVINISDWR